MSFDTLTAIAVTQELESVIVGGRVQKVVLPDADSVGFEIYSHRQVHNLIVSASISAPRILLSGRAPRRGVDRETPLLQLLRKYVRGGRIDSVFQPPLERIVRLRITSRDGSSGEIRRVQFIAELIGRQSNLILIDDQDRVMDSLKRVNRSMNRHRQIRPQIPYRPPPPLGKQHPAAVDLELMVQVAAGRPEDASWRILVETVAGVSPLVAREALHRSFGRPDLAVSEVTNWKKPLNELRRMFSAVESGHISPVVALHNGEPIAYAAHKLLQFTGEIEFESISEAADRFYDDVNKDRGFVSRRAERLRDAILNRQNLAKRRIASLERSLRKANEAACLRRAGELLLAYPAGDQQGAKSANLGGHEIAIDPTLSPVANAQSYFRRYRSAKSAAEKVPRLIRKAELEAVFVNQAQADLEMAKSESDVAGLEEILADQGVFKTKRRRPKGRMRSRPGEFEVDGWRVLVGRNAAQNDHLTFKMAKPLDLWIHARGSPGAHVLLSTGGSDVPDDVVLAAAAAAAGFSGARLSSHVDVDITERRNVRRIRGAGPGQVSYRGERTLRVKPDIDLVLS